MVEALLKRVCACLALVVTSASVAAAQTASSPWHTVPLPGGAAGLGSVLELPRPVESWRILPEAMYWAYAVPEGRSDQIDSSRQALQDYVALLDEFERLVAAAEASAGLNIHQTVSKRVRDNQKSLLRFLGFRLRERRDDIQVEPRRDRGAAARVRALEFAGLDLDGFPSRLNAGETVSLTLRADPIPLPLSPSFWSSEILERRVPENRLFAAILGDRRLLFLYSGLLSLDTPTLEYVASRPALLRRVRDRSPEAFAAFGGSIRVRDGRVVVPGGSEAEGVWRRLVDGESVQNPDRFIAELLSRNGGRLALFYDTLAQLGPASTRFALGLYLPTGQRAEAAARTWDGFLASNARTEIRARPFRRTSDAPLLLAHAAVESDGRPKAPAYRGFWSAAFDGLSLPDRPQSATGRISSDDTIDAGWLLDKVNATEPMDRPAAARLWMFGQRVFAGVPDAELPDALVALRGFIRYESLLLTLERMGIARPATYAAAVRRAAQLTQTGAPADRGVLLAQFQGALSLVERSRFRRSLTVEQADELVRSLAAIEPVESRYRGQLALWLQRRVVPMATSAGETPEAKLLDLVAGIGATATNSVPNVSTTEWEGARYRVDLAAAERERLTHVRAGQRSNRVDTAITLAEAAEALRSVPEPPALATLTSTVAAVTSAIVDVPSPGLGDPRSLALQKQAREAMRELSRIRRPKDSKRAERVSRRLRDLADVVLADALLSLAYTVHIGGSDVETTSAAAGWNRHEFGLSSRGPDQQVRRPWSVAADKLGTAGARRAEGGLLGLDLTFAAQSLRRVSMRPPPQMPSLTDADRQAITESIVLSNPHDYTDDALRHILDALGRGRQRVTEARTPEAIEALLAAGAIAGWRRGLVAWFAEQNAAPDGLFSLGELFVLGGGAGGSPRPDPWGVSVRLVTGCFCVGFPAPGAGSLPAVAGSGRLPAQVADMVLRIAEWMHGESLPARLLPGILAAATYDYIQELQRVHPDDWLSMVQHGQRLEAERLADYVAGLAGRGPLYPVDSHAQH